MRALIIPQRYLAGMVGLALLFSALAPALTRLLSTGSATAPFNALICSSNPISGLSVAARSYATGMATGEAAVASARLDGYAGDQPPPPSPANAGDCPYCHLTIAKTAAGPPNHVIRLLSDLRQQVPPSFDDALRSGAIRLRPHARGPPVQA
jgi:hypothetical protein